MVVKTPNAMRPLHGYRIARPIEHGPTGDADPKGGIDRRDCEAGRPAPDPGRGGRSRDWISRNHAPTRTFISTTYLSANAGPGQAGGGTLTVANRPPIAPLAEGLPQRGCPCPRCERWIIINILDNMSKVVHSRHRLTWYGKTRTARSISWRAGDDGPSDSSQRPSARLRAGAEHKGDIR
jgi:hypothetical protein